MLSIFQLVMLAISVSRLNLNLDEELSQALSSQTPASASGVARSADNRPVSPEHRPAANSGATPSQSESVCRIPEENAHARSLRRASETFGGQMAAFVGRVRNNAIISPPIQPKRPPHVRGAYTTSPTSTSTSTEAPSAIPASCLGRRLSLPPFVSPLAPESQPALTQEIAGAHMSVSHPKLDNEFEPNAGFGNKNQPPPPGLFELKSEEGIESPRSQPLQPPNLAALNRKASPAQRKTFSIVEDDDEYIDMFDDIAEATGAGGSACASVKSSEEEEEEEETLAQSDRPISISAHSHHSSDVVTAEPSESQHSKLRKKVSRESQHRLDDEDEDAETRIDGLIQAPADEPYRFSLDSLGGLQHCQLVELPHDCAEVPTPPENLTRRQHTYLFKVRA